MLRKILLLGVFVGSTGALPALYQSNPHFFDAVIRSAVNGSSQTRAVPEMTLASIEPQRQQALGRSILVPADERGHFIATFRINGRQTNAMIDTGATVVALNLSTARKAGISVNPGDFTQQVQTANGTVKVAVVEIGDISIGRIVLKDVQAVVIEDRALQTNLVGMSFLKRLDKFEIKDSSLLLAQ